MGTNNAPPELHYAEPHSFTNVVTNEVEVGSGWITNNAVQWDTNLDYAPFAISVQPSSNILELHVFGEPIIMVRTNGQVWLAETNNMDAMSLQFWSSVESMFKRLCPCSTNK